MTHLAIPSEGGSLDRHGDPMVYDINYMNPSSPRGQFDSFKGHTVAVVELKDNINKPYDLQDIAIAFSGILNGYEPNTPSIPTDEGATLYFHRVDDKTLNIRTHIEGQSLSQETYRMTLLAADKTITDDMMSRFMTALNGKIEDPKPSQHLSPSVM